jgi:hypothetical protein
MAFLCRQMKKTIFLNILEWALRINVFLKLTNYGLGKIVGGQFYRKGDIPEEIAQIPLGETGSYDLAWTFFGHSQGYILFIGISQLIGAFLLLFNRTKLLGGAILIPILLNIIIVDYLFGVAYGAMFSACFYLASILFVYYMERDRVIRVARQLMVFSERKMKRNELVKQGVFVLIGVIVVFFVEYFFIAYFGYEDR